MTTFIQLGKIRVNPDPIVRSLLDGPDYNPSWRFEVVQQYLIRVAQAKDSAVVLNDILSEEKDPFVRQLVLFESGRPSVIAPSIEYALRCHNSRRENLFARMISAMVVAGRSSSEIAEELGTSPAHIIAYEKLFCDLRRYLHLKFWINDLCHSPGSVAGLGEGASRCLITAFKHGWNGLATTFSKPQWDSHSEFNPIPSRMFSNSARTATNRATTRSSSNCTLRAATPGRLLTKCGNEERNSLREAKSAPSPHPREPVNH